MAQRALKWAPAILLVLGLAGLVDAALLTWDHQLHRLNPQGAGLCGIGSGCEISWFSPLSRVPLPFGLEPMPIALVGACYYVAVIFLAIRRWRRPEQLATRWLQTILAALATLLSLALLVYSLVVQGSLCPYCTVLYGVNVGLLVVSAIDLFKGRRAQPDSDKGVALLDIITGPAGRLAGMCFVCTAVLGYLLYATPIRNAKQDYHEQLMAEARGIAATEVVPVVAVSRPGHGDADAPIHIIEFADYGCPHCRHLYETLTAIQHDRPEQVRVSVLSFPLSSDCNDALANPRKGRCELALAAECAHRQARWGDLAGWLFEHASGDREEIKAKVAELGFDRSRFAACLSDPDTLIQVRKDAALGHASGVEGTPTFFVNGHKVGGARSREPIELMIDTVIAAQPAKKSKD